MAQKRKKPSKRKPIAPLSAHRSRTKNGLPTADYRHAAKTKNLPPAGLAAQGKLEQPPKIQYAYNPHLPPVLRFDASGGSDRLPELLEKARNSPLTDDEAQLLANALRIREPWLEWAGKRELPGFAVEPIALNIHERISTQAILRVAAREDVNRDLFADPQLEYREAVKFYQHDIDWANRMILGDSLQIMASLSRREGLAGKVQMIYIDPPYGIKFASNFQPEIGKRDVKDKDSDLTREAEMVKAYRDTWTLGVHSYLTYLRDRLILAREVLTDSGSVFVQISDENLHRVRALIDEIFGAKNFVSVISFRTTSGLGNELLGQSADYLVWYARDREHIKYRDVFKRRGYEDDVGGRFTRIQLPDGIRRFMTSGERDDIASLPDGTLIYRHDNLTSQSGGDKARFSVAFEGLEFSLVKGYWKTNIAGMSRLEKARRLGFPTPNSLSYIRFLGDFPLARLSNLWTDTQTGAFTDEKVYVVQTNTKVVERCVLMTTDPGDLVLDPTCGSGTTAFVAEQWGRRWITVDSSRVALALSRQRLMSARFEYYQLRPLNEEDLARNQNGTWLRDPQAQLSGPVTLDCESVPHITLKSIAQNAALDAIFAKHQPTLDAMLKTLNTALIGAPKGLATQLLAKLVEKQKREGKRTITDADRRRWLLPPANRDPKLELIVDRNSSGWYEWEVPFDTDPDWPKPLQEALTEYRAAWRARMDEVNAAIAANADQEELVDDPKKVSGIVRVAGPFTMEAVIPVESREETVFAGAPEELETFDGAAESVNAEAFQDRIVRLLKQDGVQFPGNRKMQFARLEAAPGEILHADGEWLNGDGKERKVAVSIGPEHGPVTAWQVENALRAASRHGVDDLVFAGFSFDGAAQALIQEDPNPNVRCHLAHISPDVTMGDLLKDTAGSQLFSVFGLPRVKLSKQKEGQFFVEMQGVDIYNPVENTVVSTDAERVAAWFLDSDYDGRTFCITQAFFPDKKAWEKLAKALEGHVDGSRFAAFSGTVSLAFPAGQHKRAAVKVIDPRGNEVMRLLRLDGKYD
jgi:adenine-specific DNA-methyltransferase